MTFFNCDNRRDCIGIALIASLIIGVVAAFLQITAVFTLTPIFSIVAFGIAIFYLAIILIAISLAQRTSSCNRCCVSLSWLLFGIAGTILASVVLLLIVFPATSVVGALFVGALFFFFALTIATTACFIRCLSDCRN